MIPEILRKELMRSAEALGWVASDVPSFTSDHFRGRANDVKPNLPSDVLGLRVGAYPVLIAAITLGTVEDMQTVLRSLHSQMMIARTYMFPEEVINSHILLYAANTAELADWRQVVDLAERDETVCRKIVWIPDPEALESSYEAFRARTFLATPWEASGIKLNAPLDHSQNLAQRVLTGAGLSIHAAEHWVSSVQQFKDDPDTLVEELVSTRGIL
jgi:hypothetical protein